MSATSAKPRSDGTRLQLPLTLFHGAVALCQKLYTAVRKQKPRIDETKRLPPEIWLDIADHLSLVDACTLALTCKKVCAALSRPYFSRLNEPESRKDKYLFLSNIERLHPPPNHWLCERCVKFHFFDISKPEQLLEPSCNGPYRDKGFALWPGATLSWRAVHLVMRARRLGPEYGIPIDLLNRIRDEQCGAGRWTNSVTAVVAYDSSLLLEIKGTAITQDAVESHNDTATAPTFENIYSHGSNTCGIPICRHGRGTCYWTMPQRHVLRIDCSTFDRMRQSLPPLASQCHCACLWCESDCFFDVVEVENHTIWNFSRWVDLGQGTRLSSEEWCVATYESNPFYRQGWDLFRWRTTMRFHHAQGKVVARKINCARAEYHPPDLTRFPALRPAKCYNYIHYTLRPKHKRQRCCRVRMYRMNGSRWYF